MRFEISCFERFEKEYYPATVLAYRKDIYWKIKHDNAGQETAVRHLRLPPKLAVMWEEEDAMPKRLSYDEIVLTHEDMRSIFDPVELKRILPLVEEGIETDLRAIIVVGGSSASPYLKRCIRGS